MVLGQERIPAIAPDHLDHVPASAAEDRLELLDDLAVAVDRPVQALEVAVDDEDEVRELLATRQADRAERLRLVRLAVAEEAPDLPVLGLARAIPAAAMSLALALSPPRTWYEYVLLRAAAKHPHQEFIQIDTTNILFLCGGAFVGLEDIISRRMTEKTMGFGAKIAFRKEKRSGVLLEKVHSRGDLIKYGMIPQFVGRLPVVAHADRARPVGPRRDPQGGPKNSLVKQYQTIAGVQDVQLRFTDDAIEAIAEEALAHDVEYGG